MRGEYNNASGECAHVRTLAVTWTLLMEYVWSVIAPVHFTICSQQSRAVFENCPCGARSAWDLILSVAVTEDKIRHKICIL